jgi:hypothetical protein
MIGGGWSFRGHNAQTGCIEINMSVLNITGANNVTVEAWVNKRMVTSVDDGIAGNGDGACGYLLYMNNNITYFYVGAVASQSPSQLSGNVWHHIAGVYNGSEGRIYLYIDGVQVDSDAVASIPSCTYTTWIGTYGGAPNTPRSASMFNGTLDEVRIWNRALTSSEIYAHANILTFINISAQENTDVYPPNMTFNFQSPQDISTSNIFNLLLNVSYNVSDNTSVNASQTVLYYKTNTTTEDCAIYINGNQTCGWQSAYVRNYNVSSVFNWELNDNMVYPAIYNYNQSQMFSYAKSTNTITTALEEYKIQFLNFSSTDQYIIFEVYAENITSASSPLEIRYYNSTNASIVVYELPATQAWNHSHGANSNHYVIPIAVNTTNRSIGTVNITPLSYIGLSVPLLTVGNGWNLYSISNNTQTATYTNNGGTTYSAFSGTIDSHLHSYNGTETFNYYICSNDTLGYYGCSTIRNDLLNLTGLPPTSPDVYYPVNSTYDKKDLINIQYIDSESPNGYAIMFYNISLLNVNLSFNSTISANNSVNLNYTWNASQSITNGSYIIKIEAKDNMSQSSYGYSPIFTLTNSTSSPPSDTCTYSGSGNFTITCDENCTVTSNYDIGYNWLAFYGNGTITINANITNIYGKLKDDECTVVKLDEGQA